MRNLEDCKAEVFRRSEERIKERKKARKRVLACCIPLCLLLVAGGLYLRPLMEPVDHMAGTNARPTPVPDRELGGLDGVTTGSVSPESAPYYTYVEITDRTGASEVSRKITDEAMLGALSGFMMTYFELPGAKESIADEMNGKNSDEMEYELRVKYGLEEDAEDYKLVFRNFTGKEFVFLLYGNVLIYDRTDCGVTLSDAQFSVLKGKLEQAVANED